MKLHKESAIRIRRPIRSRVAGYPLKPRIVQETGDRFTIVCLQQDDGRFVAEILNHPEIRYVGRTRRQAELVVSKLYRERDILTRRRAQQKTTLENKEDHRWLALARANREREGIGIEEYRRRRGV